MFLWRHWWYDDVDYDHFGDDDGVDDDDNDGDEKGDDDGDVGDAGGDDNNVHLSTNGQARQSDQAPFPGACRGLHLT